MSVNAEKCDESQKSDSLIAVPIRVILYQAETVLSSQQRKFRGFVMPFLLRPIQSRLKPVLIANSWQSTVFANLFAVNRVNDHAA